VGRVGGWCGGMDCLGACVCAGQPHAHASEMTQGCLEFTCNLTVLRWGSSRKRTILKNPLFVGGLLPSSDEHLMKCELTFRLWRYANYICSKCFVYCRHNRLSDSGDMLTIYAVNVLFIAGTTLSNK
jgi:hypothetical protein